MSDRELEHFIEANSEPPEDAARSKGPPPLAPFGLVLHHDGSWSHDGQPILNRRLREHFDRSVAYLPDEKKYIVRLAHFRGEIEIEEAGFFVTDIDLEAGRVRLSDGSESPLDPESFRLSPIDQAILCRVKRDLVPEGLDARFMHGPQAELFAAVREAPRGEGEAGDGYVLEVAGQLRKLPALEPS